MEPGNLIPQEDRAYYLFALKIVGDFGATLAVPVVVFVIIGRYVDMRYGSGPWCTILAFILAGFTSTKLILKKARVYGEQYQRLVSKKP